MSRGALGTISPPAMTINGEAVRSDATFDVVDPATGEAFTSVPDCDREQLDAAIAGAARAFAAWRNSTWIERQNLLRGLISAVESNVDELAMLVTSEVGKPLANAASEIRSGLAWCRFYAELDEPSEVVRDDDVASVTVQRVPLGVVAAVTAWNYPIMLALLKIGPALMAGNSVVVKPSPFTPVATLRLGQLLADIMPAGLVQVLSGGDDLGRWLTAADEVRKISFTGSVATGKAIMAVAAGTLKRVTLELGGNDAAIVLPGENPATFADPLFWAGFSNVGQVCTGMKRLFVPADEVDVWCDALAAVARTVVVGDGRDAGTQLGPIQNRPQRDRVIGLLADAVANGGRITYQGPVPDGPGFFHPITIVAGVGEGVRLVDEEQFGPVLPVLGYRSVDEAVERANATRFGLGASVWSSDVERAAAIAGRLEAGSVWVNRHPGLSPDAPFGGVKESGIGVESSHHGLAAYTDIRVLNIKHNEAATNKRG